MQRRRPGHPRLGGHFCVWSAWALSCSCPSPDSPSCAHAHTQRARLGLNRGSKSGLHPCQGRVWRVATAWRKCGLRFDLLKRAEMCDRSADSGRQRLHGGVYRGQCLCGGRVRWHNEACLQAWSATTRSPASGARCGALSTSRRVGSTLRWLATCKLAEAELRGRASALELRPNSGCVKAALYRLGVV